MRKEIAVLRKVMEINLHTATPWYSSTKSSSDAAPAAPAAANGLLFLNSAVYGLFRASILKNNR